MPPGTLQNNRFRRTSLRAAAEPARWAGEKSQKEAQMANTPKIVAAKEFIEATPGGEINIATSRQLP